MQVHLSVVRGRGAPQPLEFQAASLDEARAHAMALGYAVLSIQSARPAFGLSASTSSGRTRFDVPVFIEQLRDLLQAGLSVIEALDALRRGAKGGAVSAIDALERQLREGKTLSAALAADPVFPELLVALVKASELTSDLEQSLTRYLEHQARVAEIRHRLVSTAIYPALLIGVGGLVLVFLLFYVMPRFARVFEGMGTGNGELPWSARAMVAWSQGLHAYGAWWLGIGLLLAVAAAMVAASPTWRSRLAASVLDHPLLRDRLKVYFLSRWYRATGMLVQGGIPLPQALQLANQLLPTALQPSGLRVEAAVREGLSPSAAHARAGMVTPVAEQLMLAGERTGDLGTVLSRIAHYHEAEVTRTLERNMRALEPIVMVAIGVGVGIVVVLMYLPIFELASAIQ
jgi:general secretion pathway protein F